MNDRSLEIFSKLCAIPHPSGSEERVREFLKTTAKKAGLSVKVDAAGNLRIDRDAAAGFETRPAIVLQGHIDMVPQKNDGVDFDFEHDPIRTEIRDGWMSSACGTTLGADDGTGVAAAMSLLLDTELKCGRLAAVFTVDEEVGLTGAAALSKEMLKGDFLYNLDSEEEGIFYIGCAGGIRLRSDFALFPAAPTLPVGFRLRVAGLKGGHSGTDIEKPRGNALILAAQTTQGQPVELADFHGGKQDNAIPREATLLGATTPEGFAALQNAAAELTRIQRETLDCEPGFAITVSPAPRPENAAPQERSARILHTFATVFNGVKNRDAELGIVDTSSNFAAVSLKNGRTLHVCSSQRSLTLAGRDAMTAELIRHFASAGAKNTTTHAYSPWERTKNSTLTEHAVTLYRKLFGKTPVVTVIPAGLECGVLKTIAPQLQMLSFGPTLEGVHSPSEKLDLASYARFYRFLHELVANPPRLPEA